MAHERRQLYVTVQFGEALKSEFLLTMLENVYLFKKVQKDGHETSPRDQNRDTSGLQNGVSPKLNKNSVNSGNRINH